MTYRGIVNNGIVLLEGNQLENGTVVEVTPVAEIRPESCELANHPALGMWKDRLDLPGDAVEASAALQKKLMRRADE